MEAEVPNLCQIDWQAIASFLQAIAVFAVLPLGYAIWRRQQRYEKLAETSENILLKFELAVAAVEGLRLRSFASEEIQNAKLSNPSNELTDDQNRSVLEASIITDRFSDNNHLLNDLNSYRHVAKIHFGNRIELEFARLNNVIARLRLQVAISLLHAESGQAGSQEALDSFWKKPTERADPISEELNRILSDVSAVLHPHIRRMS